MDVPLAFATFNRSVPAGASFGLGASFAGWAGNDGWAPLPQGQFGDWDGIEGMGLHSPLDSTGEWVSLPVGDFGSSRRGTPGEPGRE